MQTPPGRHGHRAASSHAVRVYTEPAELAAAVGAYLAAGFEAGEPAVLVARPEHVVSFSDELARLGWQRERLDGEALLTTADAETTLAEIMDGGAPDGARFARVVGGLLDRAGAPFPGSQVRVFGEMVDLLCERGARQAALRLEELWNELAARRRFSLLCGYHLDVFDPDVQASLLPDVCEAHSVVVPAKNYARFARAVERALDDVLGREEANRIYVRLVRDEQDHVPMAQRLLMWVSANMPSTAERVFSAARSHYAGALGS